MADNSSNVSKQWHESDTLYPDHSQHAFTTLPVDTRIAADAPFGTSMDLSQEPCAAAAMLIDCEASLHADGPDVLNGLTSFGSSYEDNKMMLLSSSSSCASAPSATSSTSGSPEANGDEFGGVPKWSDHDMMQPSTVGDDTFTDGESPCAASTTDMRGYDFGQAHIKDTVDASVVENETDLELMTRLPNEEYVQQDPCAAAASPPLFPQFKLAQATQSSPSFHSGPSQLAFGGSSYGTPMQRNDRCISIDAYFAAAFAKEHSAFKAQKRVCMYPGCGRVTKDPKAHMLTHQNERPEKCPIQTCEYHIKGFARKYDRNRHTLTHYEGAMVCGFCTGPGPLAEKSFNRADVFKRHLTAVHGVEPPKSAKKTVPGVSAGKRLVHSPTTTSKCTTCSQGFDNAQDLYEHLDGCVRRIVLQRAPAETTNARRLAEGGNDGNIPKTLEVNSKGKPSTYSTEPENICNADVTARTKQMTDDEKNSETSKSPLHDSVLR